MHALGGNEEGTPKPKPSRLPWIVAAGVAAVALTAGGAIVVPQLFAGTPTAGESPTSTPPPATVMPSGEPSPTPASCDPSTAARIPSYDLGLSSSGDVTWRTVAEFEAEGSISPTTASMPIDDDAVALVTSANDGGVVRTNLVVVDRGSGETRWEHAFDGQANIVGTPLASGVIDRILVSHSVGDAHRLVAYSLEDGSAMTEREMTTWSYSVTANTPRGWDDWSIAAQAPGAYLLRDHDTVTRLDPDSLEVEWTIDANAIDAERYEGDSFLASHLDDTVFISGHPFDVESGEALDWFGEGEYVAATGVVLHNEYRFDQYDSYPLSAIDPRTGEVCWTAEVFDVAADDASLWVIGVDRVVSRLDPATGEVLERRGAVEPTDLEVDDTEVFDISLVEGLVITAIGPRNSNVQPIFTSWTSDGPVAIDIRESAGYLVGSSGQVLASTDRYTDAPVRVEAFNPDGAPAWSADVDDAEVFRGLITQTRVTSGVIEVDILR